MANDLDDADQVHGPRMIKIHPSTPIRRYVSAWALMVLGLAGFWCCRPWIGTPAFDYGQFIVLMLTWKAASLWCLPADGWARLTPLRLLAYLIWPGMQPRQFFQGQRTAPGAPLPSVKSFLINLVTGATLLWLVPVVLPEATPRAVRCWIGLVGLGLLSLFARFDLGTLVFRRMGFAVEKIFDRPIASTSLGEFWGRRWNRIVSGLLRELVFLPLARRVGAKVALLAVFLYSGFYHEIVSFLANSGYGGPTCYFLLQYAGVAFENTRLARRWLRGRPWLGRAWTGAVVILPVGLVLSPGLIEGRIVRLLVEAGVPGLG